MPAVSTDSQLVARCRTGEQEAWEALVERFAPYVHAICVRGFRLPAHDAEDVFQEVFARVYMKLDTLRDDGAVRPWIAQLTRRLCLDRVAVAGREDPTEVVEPSDVDLTLERLAQAWTVREALARMDDACREILDRFFARDESYQSIGADLGIPLGTVASRLSRCLAKLRVALEGRTPAGEPSG
jgi:RNA polymerase sigma factor (sigma-70 family)